MDILKSSNVERVLYDKFGSQRTKELMESLNSNGYYELTPEETKEIQSDFAGVFSSDEESKEIISQFLKENYLMDPHTATCIKAYNQKREKMLPTVAYSTAEWTKFSPTIADTMGLEAKNDKEALNGISDKFNAKIPKMISDLFQKEIKHLKIVEKSDIMQEMLDFLDS